MHLIFNSVASWSSTGNCFLPQVFQIGCTLTLGGVNEHQPSSLAAEQEMPAPGDELGVYLTG